MSNPDETPSAEAINFGQFTLFPAARLLKLAGSPLALGSRAMDILTVLVEQAGTVVGKKELIARAWPGLTGDESGLRFHIAALRKALGDGQNGNRYIANVLGRGYSFVAPVARARKADPECTAARAAITATPRGLPPRLPRLVGRDETVRDISTRLMEQRFITITGAGGMGKTTVAVSVAHELAPTFGNAVWLVDFSEVDDPDSVPGVLAAAFGVEARAPNLLPSLCAFISDKRVLLVLDNCQHVVGVVASLAQGLFKGAPSLHVLASSREALQAEGEQVYRLQPLGSPPPKHSLSAAEALTYPAVQLFVERVSANGAHIALNDMEAPIISETCSRLDGVPLAICVAAGRVGAHGLAGTADLFTNR